MGKIATKDPNTGKTIYVDDGKGGTGGGGGGGNGGGAGGVTQTRDPNTGKVIYTGTSASGPVTASGPTTTTTTDPNTGKTVSTSNLVNANVGASNPYLSTTGLNAGGNGTGAGSGTTQPTQPTQPSQPSQPLTTAGGLPPPPSGGFGTTGLGPRVDNRVVSGAAMGTGAGLAGTGAGLQGNNKGGAGAGNGGGNGNLAPTPGPIAPSNPQTPSATANPAAGAIASASNTSKDLANNPTSIIDDVNKFYGDVLANSQKEWDLRQQALDARSAAMQRAAGATAGASGFAAGGGGNMGMMQQAFLNGQQQYNDAAANFAKDQTGIRQHAADVLANTTSNEWTRGANRADTKTANDFTTARDATLHGYDIDSANNAFTNSADLIAAQTPKAPNVDANGNPITDGSGGGSGSGSGSTSGYQPHSDVSNIAGYGSQPGLGFGDVHVAANGLPQNLRRDQSGEWTNLKQDRGIIPGHPDGPVQKIFTNADGKEFYVNESDYKTLRAKTQALLSSRGLDWNAPGVAQDFDDFMGWFAAAHPGHVPNEQDIVEYMSNTGSVKYTR